MLRKRKLRVRWSGPTRRTEETPDPGAALANAIHNARMATSLEIRARPGASMRQTLPVEESPASSLGGQLGELAKLHEAGALTDAEFRLAKERLLR